VTEPEHSPKGASSAERWLNCSGSSTLLAKLKFPTTDEEEWTKLGIAAHQAASACLVDSLDAWEMIGREFHGIKVDKTMAMHIQVYLDYVSQFMRPGVTIGIEERIGADPAKRPHPDFYGTVDFDAYGAEEFRIVDFKYGEGIIVDPDGNPQEQYYAYGRLYERRLRGVALNPERKVVLAIVQPRAFHVEGPVREWDTTVGELLNWGDTVLIPAMEAVELDTDFVPGDWCRFCPAKLFCPVLTGLFGAAARANPDAIPNLSDDRLSLEWKHREAVKRYLAALEAEVYRRNMTGNTVPETKLVWKKSNRVLKEGGEQLFVARFGEEAYEPQKVKSVAQLENISAEAKSLVKEWAYMPKTGLTVAAISDKRPAVAVDKITDTFAHFATETTND